MTNLKSFSGSIAFISLMGSTASFADVTAQQVWADYNSYMSSFGYEVTSQDTVSDGMVTVDGLTMSVKLPEDEGIVKVTMGQFTLKDQGDGSVAIIFPENLPLAINAGDEFAANLNYGHTGMSLIVSGSADEMTYDLTAEKLAVTLKDLMIEGKPVPNAVLDLIMSNVVSKSVSALGNLRNMTQALSMDSLDYTFKLAEPDGDFNLNVKGVMNDVTANSAIALPQGLNFEQMAAALTAGFAVDAKIGWGAGGYEFSSTDGGDSMKGASSSESGELSVSMDRKAISYGGIATNIKASMSGSSIPLPSIDYEMAEAVFNLLMPIEKTETPGDYALTVKLGDLTVSDGIWGMLDPQSILPRTPATVNLVADGKANFLIDIMDPDNEENMNVEVPGQLHALNLKEFQVKLGGADLTADGAFTFNNDDLETFDGMPAPTGAINLKLVGGNGLLDNLIKMGYVPEDQAMGTRMMMGLFAVAGDGEDTLTSKIEVNGDGSILANGQRLK